MGAEGVLEGPHRPVKSCRTAVPRVGGFSRASALRKWALRTAALLSGPE
jgi:hypothetical protein